MRFFECFIPTAKAFSLLKCSSFLLLSPGINNNQKWRVLLEKGLLGWGTVYVRYMSSSVRESKRKSRSASHNAGLIRVIIAWSASFPLLFSNSSRIGIGIASIPGSRVLTTISFLQPASDYYGVINENPWLSGFLMTNAQDSERTDRTKWDEMKTVRSGNDIWKR